MPKTREIDINRIIEVAEKNNALLLALIKHPTFNKQNPAASPPSLWHTADFVRRTYVEYVLPLLPPQAPYKCFRLASPMVIQYDDNPSSSKALPDENKIEEGNAYLLNPKNWPKENKQFKERWLDAMSRTVQISLLIVNQGKDKVEGASEGEKKMAMFMRMMSGINGGTEESFDFGDEVREVVAQIQNIGE